MIEVQSGYIAVSFVLFSNITVSMCLKDSSSSLALMEESLSHLGHNLWFIMECSKTCIIMSFKRYYVLSSVNGTCSRFSVWDFPRGASNHSSLLCCCCSWNWTILCKNLNLHWGNTCQHQDLEIWDIFLHPTTGPPTFPTTVPYIVCRGHKHKKNIFVWMGSLSAGKPSPILWDTCSNF